MKKIILFSIVTLMLQQSPAGTPPALEGLVGSTPNIVLGKVFCKGPAYFLVDIGWEIKGKLNAALFEVAMDNETDRLQNVKEGDRVLVFINRELVKPMQTLPHKDIQASRFDEFDGQSAFMLIENDGDYTVVSDVYSLVSRDQLASAFSF